MLSRYGNNNYNSNYCCYYYFGRGNAFFWGKNDCCFSVGLFVGPTFMFPSFIQAIQLHSREGGGCIQRILEQCIFLLMFDA